jgi:hypothetical protein
VPSGEGLEINYQRRALNRTLVKFLKFFLIYFADSVKEMLVSGGGSGDFPPSIFFNSICDAVTSLSMA